MAKEDLAGRPERFKTDFTNLIKSLPEGIKNAPNVINAIKNEFKMAGEEITDKFTKEKDEQKKAANRRREKRKRRDVKAAQDSIKKAADKKGDKVYTGGGPGGGFKKGGLMKRNYP